MKIKELSKLVGVTIRTLHYYDEIGLLSPQKDDAGYRIYSENDIKRLSEILMLKELEFSLTKIKVLIDEPLVDKEKALLIHRDILEKKNERIYALIDSIDNILRNGFEIEIIKNFNKNDYKRYKDEAIKKYGDSAVQSYKKTDKLDTTKWNSIQDEMKDLFSTLATYMDKDVSDDSVQILVNDWRNYITDNFYDCTLEILKGLGELYISDKRFEANIDKTKIGLSNYFSKAIKYYCNVRTK